MRRSLGLLFLAVAIIGVATTAAEECKADDAKPSADSSKKSADKPSTVSEKTASEKTASEKKPDSKPDAKALAAKAKAKADADKILALPPRPPPFKADPPFVKLKPIHRFDIGADALLVNRLASDYIEGTPSNIAYRPTIGFGFHARIQVIRYLQIGAYFGGADHGMAFGPNALGVHGTLKSDALTTLWFGGKIMPTLPIGDHVRLWLEVGVGWGRFEFPQMTATEPGHDPFIIKGRGNSFVEFPMGIGASFEVIKNWLSIDTAITAAPMVHKAGTSFVPAQALDNGHERTISPLDEAHLSIVQSLGLSLLL